MDRDILLAAENALIDLRRNVPRDLHGQRRKEVVGGFKLPVHSLDAYRLSSLHAQEGYSANGGQHKIGKQILERKQIRGNRLRDDDFLDAANITDFPILFSDFRDGRCDS